MFLNILKQPSISYVLRKLFPLVCELFSHSFYDIFARKWIYFNSVKANVLLGSWISIMFCLRSRENEIISLNVQSSVNKWDRGPAGCSDEEIEWGLRAWGTQDRQALLSYQNCMFLGKDGWMTLLYISLFGSQRTSFRQEGDSEDDTPLISFSLLIHILLIIVVSS